MIPLMKILMLKLNTEIVILLGIAVYSWEIG
jgi:hypothetical protein